MAGRKMPGPEVLQSVGDLIVKQFNALPREQRFRQPTRVISQEGSLACHVGAFTVHGRNIFLLSPDLTEMLSRTDLHGVHAGDLRMPFPTFYVSFGDSFDGSLPGPPNQIDGAYLTAFSNDSLQVLVTSRRLDVRPDRAKRWPFSRDLYYYTPLDTSDPDRTFDKLIRQAVETKEISVEPELIEPDGDIVLGTGTRQILVRDVRHETQAEHAEYMREGLAAFGRALSLGVNAVCYLNASSDEGATEVGYPDDAPTELVKGVNSERRSTRNSATAGLLDKGFMQVYLIGRSVRVSDETEGSNGREVSTHWRRGHWRRQPVGPSRSERRLTWVRPALVRADKGEATAGHVYRVR
jgi:hypothetical protein